MNLLSLAIQNVRMVIPEAILTEALMGSRYRQRGITYSLDAMIRSEVFERRMKAEMNMVGGTEMLIPLRNAQYLIQDNVNVIVRIPREYTQGRNITTPLSISLADNYAPATSIGASSAQPNSPYLQAVNSVINNVLDVPLVGSARLRLIDESTILINEAPSSLNMCYLRCITEYDSEMTAIQPASYPLFSEMLVLATKSWIYNELIIKMGKGYLTGGMELGVFKEVVDSYADSETLYRETLVTRWIKVALFNDSLSKQRHLTMVSTLI
jgi:hypothetical protein